MLGKVFSVMSLISIVFALFTGNMTRVSSSIIIGVSDAVDISISLLGMMCLWNGIMRVFDKSGVTKLLTKLIKPLIKLIVPKKSCTDEVVDSMGASIAANFLGLGSAALPLGIRTMKSLSGGENSDIASDEMIMFAVLCTAPFQLIPSTLIALRTTHKSASPFEIITPIWICSIVTIAFCIVLCKLLSKLFEVKSDNRNT